MYHRKMYNLTTHYILNPKLTRNKYMIFKRSLFILCIITSFLISHHNLKGIITVYGQLEKDIEFQESLIGLRAHNRFPLHLLINWKLQQLWIIIKK